MAGARKIDRGDTDAACPVHRDAAGTWQIRGYADGRALLRSTETVQAGLGVETVEKLPARLRRPVLYRDGEEHREHRRQTARYFTPKRVDEHYRELMHEIADREIALLRAQGRANLSQMSFRLAVDVTKAVVGLTDSKPGTDRRLEVFFPEKFSEPGFTSIAGLLGYVRQMRAWGAIYFDDVRPAVRVRRKARRDDLISHLIDEGCADGEILGECLTFAAAGMVTTREFINLAAWHLFTDDALRTRFRAGSEAERLALLQELLRLEPVISDLKRRTVSEVVLPSGATIPAGELVDVAVSVANVDPGVVGDQPLDVCPGRALSGGAGAAVLSFGDGPHKCPGAHIALQESEIFLGKLFALDGLRMENPPRVTMKPEISGYELRDLIVAV
ncbi:cytochrome P450 [Nocardia sp. NPDC057668]|uniref:cytochrome P450 n=1 Tax=Nocardia sp. NPDC057668 TaxID=3346202 RepID=UPI0036732D00